MRLMLLLERGEHAYLRRTLAMAERWMLLLRCCRRREEAVVGRRCLRMRGAEGRQDLRCDVMRCEAKQCDKLRHDAIAMICDAGARWDAMRGARTWDKASAGELGQQRAPVCLRRARSAGAAASCLSGIRGSGGGVGRSGGCVDI